MKLEAVTTTEMDDTVRTVVNNLFFRITKFDQSVPQISKSSDIRVDFSSTLQ